MIFDTTHLDDVNLGQEAHFSLLRNTLRGLIEKYLTKSGGFSIEDATRAQEVIRDLGGVETAAQDIQQNPEVLKSMAGLNV